MNSGWGVFYEIALRWMPLDLTDKSTLVQVMAWCRQATSHYLSQCWSRSMSPNDVTRPQWVKRLSPLPEPILTKFYEVIWYHQWAQNFHASLTLCPTICGIYTLWFRFPWWIDSISQIPQCTCSISHHAPFRTKMCKFLFWKLHDGMWDRCIAGFVNLIWYSRMTPTC